MGTLRFCETHNVLNCHECFYKPGNKDTRDLPRAVIEQKIKENNALGWTCWTKWTCVHCAQRNVADKTNVVEEQYVCPKCRFVNHPSEFGLRMAKGGGF